MKKYVLVLWFVLAAGFSVYGGTIKQNFSDGTGDKFVLSIDTNYWSAITSEAGLTIKRLSMANYTSNTWTMSFDLTKITKSGSHDLTGDFSVTVRYTGYSGWYPTYDQANRFYIINANWGYLGGEYAYISRNAGHNWVTDLYPIALTRMHAGVEAGEAAYLDWGAGPTAGTVTLARSGNVFTMTVDGQVVLSSTRAKLADRPLATDIWMNVSIGGMTALPQVTIESITISGTDVCSQLDLSGDCNIDMADYALLAGRWIDGCDGANQWCGGADIDMSGQVDTADIRELAAQWLK